MTELVMAAERLVKTYGKTKALKGVDIALPQGAFVVLLGAAGAGKTTTLRTLAGLEPPDSGRVVIGGRDATFLEPKDRDIAMIFDSLALYPNRTGRQNLAHPLQVRGHDRAEIDEKVEAIASTLKISHILNRLPKTMSGGERQRVALGRALVRQPAFFLLDEPLSSLDAMLRVELRAELKRLQREHNYAFLMATPDFAEALAVADSVIMLIDGVVRQVAPPQTLYDAPVDREVARFVGAPEINILDADYDPSDGGRVRISDLVLPAPPELRRVFNGVAASFEAGLRPEHIGLAAQTAGSGTAEIIDVEPLGLNAAITLRAAGKALRVTLPARDAEAFPVGAPVDFEPDLDHMLSFDSETGQRLT
ncbi:MAG TPA: ABC transporter ATP-binding protein [Kiloniellaceae bacterium]|nr:ABC transporter ATP-binding protein [Kiloniellaceae bacterium]